MKKIIIILSIIAMGLLSYKIVYDINKDKPKYEIKSTKLEVNEKRLISNFIEADIVDDYEIYETELGIKEYNFSYYNKGKVAYGTIEIEVVDTTKPVVLLDNIYTVNVGFDEELLDLIVTADNYDPSPKKEIIGEYDTSEIGEYELEYIAIDKSGNKNRVPFVLKVKEKAKSISTSTKYSDIVKNYKTDKVKIGVDVSSWQGSINFSKLAKSDVDFMYIRVGRQKDFGKESVVDSYFKKNIKAANEYKIDAGVYYYSYATTREEARDQALWVIEQIKDYDVKLPIAFDWESFDKFNSLNLNLYQFNAISQEFIKTLNENGYEGILYGSKNYLENIYMPTSNVWLAHYTDKTNYSKPYKIWQICDNGKIDGISGTVDIDIMY